MKRYLTGTVASLSLILAAGVVHAQTASSGSGTPAATLEGGADGTSGGFSGYVPSAANYGPIVRKGADGEPLPEMSDGNVLTSEKIEGFNEAVEDNFPMTPEMIRQYRQIFDANQRALLERDEPTARVEAGFISLEPGEAPPVLTVAPGIASVLGFYDVTGQPWPITQIVAGAAEDFQVLQLGELANNVAVTPLTKIGFTNLVVVLKDEPKPIVLRVGVSQDTAHYRQDYQIMQRGPNAAENTASNTAKVTEAGSEVLLSFLAGTGLPAQARSVTLQNVDARAWVMGDNIYVRSKHPVIGPAHTAAMSGPDGVRVYEVPKSFSILFSVDGQMTRADVVLP